MCPCYPIAAKGRGGLVPLVSVIEAAAAKGSARHQLIMQSGNKSQSFHPTSPRLTAYRRDIYAMAPQISVPELLQPQTTSRTESIRRKDHDVVNTFDSARQVK